MSAIGMDINIGVRIVMSRMLRRNLKLNDHDDSRIEVPYEEFIASSPIIWEEREPISDFVFDVEPLVYLFKDNSYIEENLHGAWYKRNIK